MERLVASAVQVLSELGDLLKTIPEDIYVHPIKQMSNGTIGQHTRHVIEFFQCLILQLDSKVINYCQRKRDHELENSNEFAISAIANLLMEIPTLQPIPNLRLETDKAGTLIINSNLERELYYLIEHTIHHLAMIRMGLKTLAPQIQLPADFGVAPSTVSHRKRLAADKISKPF